MPQNRAPSKDRLRAVARPFVPLIPRVADQETRGGGPNDHRRRLRTQCMGERRTLSGVRISVVCREFMERAHLGRWLHVRGRSVESPSPSLSL